MRARILELSAEDISAIRAGYGVKFVDSDGRPGSVSLELGGDTVASGLSLLVSRVDLDLIESQDGLVCASTDRSTGWTVRMMAEATP